jgi:hypothetical protein
MHSVIRIAPSAGGSVTQLTRSIVVLGGYGTFGRLISASLAKHGDIRVVVAGRNGATAERLCRMLGTTRVEPATLDCASADFAHRLGAFSPTVVIDTVGPFQARSYSVPRACIEIGAHCIDLADGREYVTGISALDESARARGVLIASGTSTCPAISTAVADELTHDLKSVEALELGIAPGQKAPRGLATTQAVLSYCGKPIPSFVAGREGMRPGWSDIVRRQYPQPVGARWLAQVDLPELALWPRRYACLRSVDTRASLESQTLHFGLAMLSRLVRRGLVSSLEPYAQTMLRISKGFEPFGRDVGGMHVSATGRMGDRLVRRTWAIVASRGDGPQIPSMPAAALAKKLLGLSGYAPVPERGAMPCLGLLSVAEILTELRDFAIEASRDDRDIQ